MKFSWNNCALCAKDIALGKDLFLQDFYKTMWNFMIFFVILFRSIENYDVLWFYDTGRLVNAYHDNRWQRMKKFF